MKIKTIGLVAPCGNIKNIEELNKNIEILSKRFKIKKFYNEKVSNGYLSDTDENRIRYFESAFLDDEVDLILNIRGGYGAIRIVDSIDYDLIKNSQKKYCSSSDGTILLMSLFNKTNIECYHGLMLMNGFLDNLKQNIDIIENNKITINPTPIKKGTTSGILWGGNLSSIVSMFSENSYIPKKNIILFLEDLNEPLYKIDKMFYEIYRKKELKEKIKGIIFGDFYLEKETIMPLIKEYSEIFNVPTYIDENITHKNTNITIPYGKFINLK